MTKKLDDGPDGFRLPAKDKLAMAVRYVANGNFAEIAARAVGIKGDVFRRVWALGSMKACPSDVEPNTWELAVWYVDQCEQAEARFEADSIKSLAESKGQDAIRDLLSKRFDRWNKRERRDVQVDARVRADLESMTDEQLMGRLRELGLAPSEELEGLLVAPVLPEKPDK